MGVEYGFHHVYSEHTEIVNVDKKKFFTPQFSALLYTGLRMRPLQLILSVT